MVAQPSCPHCRAPLLTAKSTTCPSCGKRLSASRRWWPWILLMVAFVFLLGAGGAAYLLRGWLTRVAGEIASNTPSLGSGAAAPAGPSPADTAWLSSPTDPDAAAREAALKAIQPPPLAQDRVDIGLPSVVTDVCVGGGGRYFIFYMPQLRKLAVLDVNQARIVKYLPLTDDEVVIAASINKLIVAMPGRKRIERWSLETFEKEKTADFLRATKGTTIALGHASSGPLAVCTPTIGPRNSLRFFDVSTFEEVPMTYDDARRVMKSEWSFISASANGRTFAVSGHQECVTIDGERAQLRHELLNNYGAIFPSTDGRVLYAGGATLTTELTELAELSRQEPPHKFLQLPAVHGDYHLSLPWNDTNGTFGEKVEHPEVVVHRGQNRVPLTKLGKLAGLEPISLGGSVRHLSLSDRLYLVPRAKLLLTLPGTADRVILHRLDLDALEQKAAPPSIKITSEPLTRFQPGTTWSYTMAAESPAGGLKYRLKAAPPGMTVSDAGALTWASPRDWKESRAEVIVTVSDAAGGETLHPFVLVSASFQRPPAPTEPPAFPERPEEPDEEEVVPKPEPRGPVPDYAKSVELVCPAPIPVPIEPARFTTDAVTTDLPERVTKSCLGGGGRYLVLHIAAKKMLIIYDLSKLKTAKIVPLRAASALFAAGMSRLLIVYPETNEVERWSLVTFKREATASLPFDKNPPHAVAMGAATEGPLVLSGIFRPDSACSGATLAFLDIESFKEVRVARCDGHTQQVQKDQMLRVSANGRLVAASESNQLFSLNGNAITVASEQMLSSRDGYILPGPDGRVAFSDSGLWTAKGVRTESYGQLFKIGLPSTDANFYMTVDEPDKPKPWVTIRASDGQALGKRTDLGDLTNFKRDVGVEKLLLAPQAGVIVRIAGAKLHLHRFDLKALLDAWGGRYLQVTSVPPLLATRGKQYEYVLKALVKRGPGGWTLEAGPPGMKVSGDGRLNWEVPADFAASETPVLLALRDADKQMRFQAFSLKLAGEAPPPGPVAAPPPGDRSEPAPVQVARLAEVVEERSLPEAIARTCVGADGRYLIFDLPALRALAIFDTAETRVVRYLPAPADEFLFTAGRDCVMIARPAERTLERWSLITFQREAQGPCPVTGIPRALAMGSASTGPLVIGVDTEERRLTPAIQFVDPKTLKRSPTRIRGEIHCNFKNRAVRLSASADGRLFVAAGPDRSVHWYQQQGAAYEARSLDGAQNASCLPSADGQYLLAWWGTYNATGVSMGSRMPEQCAQVPAVHGPFFISINPSVVWLGTLGNAQPVADPRLKELDDFARGKNTGWNDADQHLFLIPRAKLLITIPASGGLILHRFDTSHLLKARRNEFYVESPPVTKAERGKRYSYAIQLGGKAEGVGGSIEFGPAGMTVDADNRLTWDVPDKFATGPVDVILKFTAKGRRDMFQTFTVEVR